jgi:phosphoglucomutase
MQISPLAGTSPTASMLVDVPRLVTAYYSGKPDAAIAAQCVAFGTSGHRGSAFDLSFNENHVLAITQAICQYRKQQGIDGPLFLGIDTHALSEPAFASALEVLAANGVAAMISKDREYTPTPAVSHAIIAYNRGRSAKLADGIVVTPSHNPPESGGFKYNPPHGGPADTKATKWIEDAANAFLKDGMRGVARVPFDRALQAATTHSHDYLDAYTADLGAVIDMEVIRNAKLRIGVDPMGGAGVHYWERIAERYRLDISVLNREVDPTFRFMTLDWDGRIRMDPSSEYAMKKLIARKDEFDIACACDTDHDRHGIVTRSVGLLPTNHYLAVAIDYLFQHRPKWEQKVAVGKTVVSSQMIDRVCARLGRTLNEVPVGFKWFVDGLHEGSIGFCGEESAGACFLRIDGALWTTDKDGITPALLSAEMTARIGRDPGESYNELTKALGVSYYDRVEAPANAAQKQALGKLSPAAIKAKDLAGEKIKSVIDKAPGNNAPIGGIRVVAENGWFAARPSGTEDIYKIYAESFRDEAHLKRIVEQAQTIVDAAISGNGQKAA